MGSEGVWNKIDSGVGYSEIPFSEVINFSDADGIIGPVASKKLQYPRKKRDFINPSEFSQKSPLQNPQKNR